ITRTGENQKLMIDVKDKSGAMQKVPVADRIFLNKSAKGHTRQMGLEHVMSVYTIWQFAENKEGAQQFLIDLVKNYDKAFLASEFYNFPSFTKTVPKLQEYLKKDSKSVPADKYAVLSDALSWATNVGYPGYSNAAVGEAWDTWVINTMFAKAATGQMSPEAALDEAEKRCQAIWAKWKEKKMI
ncbi:MAG TPA: carbohydrate ABC transporter substrate-binding protein, partial [bacterium]